MLTGKIINIQGNFAFVEANDGKAPLTFLLNSPVARGEKFRLGDEVSILMDDANVQPVSVTLLRRSAP